MRRGQDGLTPRCPQCKSHRLVKNGHNARGTQQYRCKVCGKGTVLNPRILYPPEKRARILAAYYAYPSLRRTARTFGVARRTLATWLRRGSL